jgi:hypothetical protein
MAALMTDFEQAANFISFSVQPLKSQTRVIGGISSDQGRGQGRCRGGRGGGHQLGRGGHNGRQGHGGRGVFGRNPGRGRQGARQGSRGISTGYYTPEEWQTLTPDQCTAVMDA